MKSVDYEMWSTMEICEIYSTERSCLHNYQYLFSYMCVYSLLIPTNAHIILIYILYITHFFSFSPSHLFQLATILSELTTKWLKTPSNKLVLTMLCMCLYRITRTDLLLWVLSYLVVRSMRMVTSQNMYEPDKVQNMYIYTHILV